MLKEIKSKYILKSIFSYLKSRFKLKIIKHNKKLLNKLNISKKTFEKYILLKELNEKYKVNIQDIDIKILSFDFNEKIIKILNQLELKELNLLDLSQKGLKKINFFQDLLLNFKELNLSDNRIVNID